MILLWGIPSEPPMRLAIDAAERAGVDHVVVNQRRAARYDIVLDIADRRSGCLVVEDREIALDDVTGVYVRTIDPAQLPEHRAGAPADDLARSRAFHAIFGAWVEEAPCRIANRIGPMASNGSKPFQAQLINRAGLATPPTLVTNDAAAVDAFERCHGPLIYKSTSSVRSIVHVLDDAGRTKLGRIEALPVQFQRREPGNDVRVHVVGGVVLAARAVTDAVDYRYASADGIDIDLAATDVPDDVAAACRELSRALELPFCGIDLMERPDGAWVCFEVNPSPGYSWYEEAAGLPISDHLVAWLAGAEEPGHGADRRELD